MYSRQPLWLAACVVNLFLFAPSVAPGIMTRFKPAHKGVQWAQGAHLWSISLPSLSIYKISKTTQLLLHPRNPTFIMQLGDRLPSVFQLGARMLFHSCVLFHQGPVPRVLVFHNEKRGCVCADFFLKTGVQGGVMGLKLSRLLLGCQGLPHLLPWPLPSSVHPCLRRSSSWCKLVLRVYGQCHIPFVAIISPFSFMSF